MHALLFFFLSNRVQWDSLESVIFLLYLEVPEPQVSTFCDVCEASGNIGIVQSPGFGEQGYSNYQDCTITIRLEQQGPQRVNVTLDYFETALDCDYLFIDGDERSWFSGSWSGESIIGKYGISRTKWVMFSPLL